MLKAGFIGAGGRSQGAHYPNVHRLERDVEMCAVCELDENAWIRLQKIRVSASIYRSQEDARRSRPRCDLLRYE